MRVVLDTDVVIAALRSATGASAALVRLVIAGKITPIVNVPLAVEYEAKCLEHALETELDIASASLLACELINRAEKVENYFLWRPLLPDPDDEMVLEAAINGRADALVSFNHKDFRDLPARFGIELLKPVEVLWRLSDE